MSNLANEYKSSITLEELIAAGYEVEIEGLVKITNLDGSIKEEHKLYSVDLGYYDFDNMANGEVAFVEIVGVNIVKEKVNGNESMEDYYSYMPNGLTIKIKKANTEIGG